MIATRLVFVRHGQALGADNRCIGHTDLPLSPEGASALRELVADGRHRPIDRIVSSDLCRAVESAEVMATALGCRVQQDPRLREMDFGRWDGQSWTQIERDDADLFRAWMERWTDVAPPDGESATDLLHRATDWMAETLATTTADDRIIIVSHAGWIRAALTHLLGRELAHMFDIPVDHARATIVDVSPAGCVLVASNAPRLDA